MSVQLDGIRVLEIAGGVGVAWAGKLFADLGADVVRLEAGEDLVRARPHDIHIWLNTSKRAIDDEPATRHALIAGADILLHGLGPARAEAEQLAFAELLAIAPRLVVCSITPWGMTGPYANYEAEELTVIHGSSWGYLSPGGATRVDLPPLKGPGHHATLNVATIAAEWFASRLVREVFHAGQRVGVCLNPVNPVSALADDEHLRARGFLARSPGGQLLPGSGARLEPAGWALRRDAPAPGQHNGESWLPRDDRRAQVAGAGPAGRLLEGVRVLDFTWVWAGPFCTQYLAHLGADVLRVESPGRADILRRMPFTPKGIKRTLDTSGPFQVYNSDKRSVAMDLGHPDARGLVLRMVERCDVVVENFSVGTMAQLGLGVDDLRAVNPAVIVASLTGFGQTGPYAGYTAYGPAGGAMTGLFAANGYADGDVAETGIAVGDPGLGIAAAWSIVAALVSRRRGGGAARIDAAMVEAVAATLGELWMEHLATGADPPRRGNHDPSWAPHSCYPAAGKDRWVTVACPNNAAWHRLASVVGGGLTDDERFATEAGRKQHEDDLDTAIASWTMALDRWEVTRRLQAVGVAAFPSLSPGDLWQGDPHLAALGMLEQPDHPATGARTIPGVPWRLTNGPNGLRRPAPLIGQHTDEVLPELLGLQPADVAELRRRGVLP